MNLDIFSNQTLLESIDWFIKIKMMILKDLKLKVINQNYYKSKNQNYYKSKIKKLKILM